MASTFVHSNITTGSELHYSKLETISGSPTVIPTYVGQTQYDSVNNILYIATGATSLADWQSQSATPKIVEKTASTYTVVSANNGNIISMLNTGTRTVTLPASPINGFYVGVQDGAGNAFTNNITVIGNGSLFTGGGTTYKIISDTSSFMFLYDYASTTWIVVSSFIGLTPIVKTLVGAIGNPLTLVTEDTSSILLNVNDVNALTVSTTNVEIKKTLYLSDITDISKQLLFDISNSTTGVVTSLNTSSTVNRTLTLPDITDTIVTKNSTDILTNKSFNSTTVILGGNQLRFNNSGNTFSTSLVAGANSANLSLTLPITAPIAGQALYSSDTAGTLGWTTLVTRTSVDILLNKSVNDLKFNNPTNTFYTDVIGGSNTGNLTLTLPISAPVAGQVLYSSDTIGSLGWLTVPTITQQSVVGATDINSLPSNTSSVLITGSIGSNLNGITAGTAGQEITVTNKSTVTIAVINLSGSASAANRIEIPNSLNLGLPPNFSLKFQYDATATNWKCVSQISSGNIIGKIPTSSSDVISAGFIGERIALTTSSPVSFSSLSVWQSLFLTPLALTKGEWEITAVCAMTLSSLGQELYCVISNNPSVAVTPPGGLPTDAVYGDNYLYAPSLTGDPVNFCIASYNVILSSNTNYYLLCGKNTVTYGGSISGRISARRVG